MGDCPQSLLTQAFDLRVIVNDVAQTEQPTFRSEDLLGQLDGINDTEAKAGTGINGDR